MGENMMHSKLQRLTWAGAAMIGALGLALSTHAQNVEKAALAAALKNVPTTLEQGLRASEKTGKPISGKFEIENGKLQLSVYTAMTDGYTEVVIVPANGSIASSEKITDEDDLKAAKAQKAAMDKAKVSLVEATEQAVRQNTGARAVSIYPELKNDQPVAGVTLLHGDQFTTVSEKLN
jgi:hypothetical protein